MARTPRFPRSRVHFSENDRPVFSWGDVDAPPLASLREVLPVLQSAHDAAVVRRVGRPELAAMLAVLMDHLLDEQVAEGRLELERGTGEWVYRGHGSAGSSAWGSPR